MTPVFPFYTAIYAAILGLPAAILTVNVIVNRVRAKVDVADGGVAALGQAIRAHGNFAEHTPLALLLIGLVKHLATNHRSLSGWERAFGRPLAQCVGPQLFAPSRLLGGSPVTSLTVLVTAASAAFILYAVIPH